MYSGLSLEDLKVRGSLIDLGINNRLITKLTFFFNVCHPEVFNTI